VKLGFPLDSGNLNVADGEMKRDYPDANLRKAGIQEGQEQWMGQRAQLSENIGISK
jgi:hypothetical protein